MEVLLTNNFQPDLLVGGVRLGEPMTAFTSLLMALVCFYAWYRLGRMGNFAPEVVYFRLFFLLMSFSAVAGAIIGHLFLYLFPFSLKIPGWMLGMIALAALVQASILRMNGILATEWPGRIIWLNILTLLLGAVWLVTALWFPVVEIHAAIGLLCMVFPMELMRYKRTSSVSSRYMLTGIGLLVTAVLFHIGKISLGIWFSFFDIAHLIMCGAFWYFLLGAEAEILARA